ncbi:hypothetical protein [Hymenobacter perfusus]|uniref:ATP-binding protein n=1 Tax=Hymenobacter perfusus TaxID=1236770 RepID=A0A428JXH4_9BACT|nr:hypothetical protein [Hymenobacter perfusus]RSK38776.1 hypothetical protein EI293_21025 [Hymenobacter perfusus]
MPNHSSVTSTGGLGTNFEQYIQAAFLVGLLTGGATPCIPDARITKLNFQTTDLGYATDDLLVTAQSETGQQHRLLLQIKHNLTFSAGNESFEKVLKQLWEDYQAAGLFDSSYDRLVIVKSNLTKDEHNHIKIVLNWARFNSSSAAFFQEVGLSQQKQTRIEVFRTVLAKVNNRVISDDELWRFLRCVELLDYDLKSTGSVDEAFLLQLINLANPNPDTITPLAIWREAVEEAEQLDNNGGGVDIAALPVRPLYGRFASTRLRPVRQAVQRLTANSRVLTGAFRNAVDGVTLPRHEGKTTILQALEQSQVVLVTGGAGVGKSALVRDVLAEYVSGSGYWAFRAEQFNLPTLVQFFTQQGIQEELPSLLACWALLPQKVLYIDSAEKLLEGPADDAFHQLLALVKDFSDVKLVLTARQYAVELLINRYRLEKSSCVTVPQLSDEELTSLSTQAPKLPQLLGNEKLRELLRSLKYLDLAVALSRKTLDDLSAASLIEFKAQLWEYVVEDARNQQDVTLPRRRGRAFQAIVLRRAQRLAMSVGAEDQDEAALQALVRDDLLFQVQNTRERGFSPTHDVLEDLALVRFIHGEWRPEQGVAIFFAAIGSSPALRRGFRLWVEEMVTEDVASVLPLLSQVLSESSTEKYWLDETLVAVFRSSNSQVFFDQFERELLSGEARLLGRCLRLLHTACIQRTYLASKATGLVAPIGSGWAAALGFCARHLDQVEHCPFDTVQLLRSWKAAIGMPQDELPAGAPAAASIVFYLFEQLEQGHNLWRIAADGDSLDGLVTLAFEVAELAADQLRGLLQRAITPETDADGHRRTNLHEKLVCRCLSGMATAQVCRYLPEVVVEVLNHEWRARPRQTQPDHYFSFQEPLNREEQYGIAAGLSLDSASIFNTPVWNLLQYRAEVGIPFVVDLVNYCTQAYRQNRGQDEALTTHTFTTTNGTLLTQYGSHTLWDAYRGRGYVPAVLASVLMSVEKFFLESAPGEQLNHWFEYVLTRSESVALTGVLASAAMARPEEFEGRWVPLLSVQEFIEWDASRAHAEYMSSFGFGDTDNHLARWERAESNKLPHRQGYFNGLGSFVAHYLAHQGEHSAQILAILDLHQAAVTDATNLFWRKQLNEMDLRTWQVTIDKEQNLATMQPAYDAPVQTMLTEHEPYAAAQSQQLRMAAQIGDFLDGKPNAAWEVDTWLQINAEYTRPGRKASDRNRLVGLAMLGLTHFSDSLDVDQTNWCWNTLRSCLEFKLATMNDHEMNVVFDERNNLFDEEHLFQCFSLLYGFAPDETAEQSALLLLLRTITAPLYEHKQKYLFSHLRGVFFTKYPELLPTIWAIVVEQARQVATVRAADNYHHISRADSEAAKLASLTTLLAGPIPAAAIDQLCPPAYDPELLVRALLLIPPATSVPLLTSYFLQMTHLLVADLSLPKHPSYSRDRDEERKFGISQLFSIRTAVGQIMLFNDTDLAKSLLETLLRGLNQQPVGRFSTADEFLDFVKNILTRVIIELDLLGSTSANATEQANRTQHFWQLWEHLLSLLITPATLPLAPLALLDIQWEPTFTHWQPFETGQTYYQRAVQQFGPTHLRSWLKVLATVGNKTMLPQALPSLVEICRNHPEQVAALYHAGVAGLFVERLFQYHMRAIQQRDYYLTSFMWVLDTMVNFGSSTAYLVREDAVTFKGN